MSIPKYKPVPFIVGDRLDIVVFDMQYLDVFNQWFNTAEVRRYARNPTPSGKEEMETWLKIQISQTDRIGFIIWEKVHQIPIGEISLENIRWDEHNAWIGYSLGEITYWNQGYTTEAVKLIMRYAFDELNLHKLRAGIYAPNIPSQKVAMKSGMHLEIRLHEEEYVDGQYYDSLIYAIFESEWRSRNG